jgi:hypothetical protein
MMKRNRPARRTRRMPHRITRAHGALRAAARVDGRVTLAVLWALGRLALRLGPA